jgi:hypothetical protein
METFKIKMVFETDGKVRRAVVESKELGSINEAVAYFPELVSRWEALMEDFFEAILKKNGARNIRKRDLIEEESQT